MLDCSIVIVSWNVRDLLRDCLNSIIQPRDLSIAGVSSGHFTAEVIVIDAASTDGSASMVNADFPWARLIELQQNVGFSKGNNIGIGASQGRYVLLLNPDTRILGSAVS